ncbi:unnamed protein product [Cylicostephanus goldi]|uniref:Uncharacterized protein n=1 Tax=Cylicostephanus goldi TaxID=71465 RepID=A0A3P7NKX3_CYLGO|nr:unnamed protein product [Cylicostephanus goldi]
MVAIDVNQVDENAWLDCKDVLTMLLNAIPVNTLLETQQVQNAWLDCKDLLTMLLNAIPVNTLLETQQIMLLTALETCPPHVVTALASHFITNEQQVAPLLDGVAQAVAVAFARRINHPDTYEQVCFIF